MGRRAEGSEEVGAQPQDSEDRLGEEAVGQGYALSWSNRGQGRAQEAVEEGAAVAVIRQVGKFVARIRDLLDLPSRVRVNEQRVETVDGLLGLIIKDQHEMRERIEANEARTSELYSGLPLDEMEDRPR